MRFTPLLAGCTLFWLLLPGTAHAASYPVNDPVLTQNNLYGSGKLKPSECPEPDINQNDIPSAKRYLTSILNCLNASWATHLKQADLPFTKARIGFITKPKNFCGHAWGEIAPAKYCSTERRFLILLDDSLLDDPSDLYLFQIAAHEYGHHIQNVTGIDRAFQYYPYKGNNELNEQIRRNELQAECLGGAFIGSVWKSLNRTDEDWEKLLDITRDSGDESTKIRDHGKGRNIVAWLDKGFHAASPAVCNTWTAPTSKVS